MKTKSKAKAHPKTEVGPMANFPLVSCSTHPNPEPGYAVCIHVVRDRAPVALYEPANQRNLGTVCCADCYLLLEKQRSGELVDAKEFIEAALDNFTVACAGHVREEGWDKVRLQ